MSIEILPITIYHQSSDSILQPKTLRQRFFNFVLSIYETLQKDSPYQHSFKEITSYSYYYIIDDTLLFTIKLHIPSTNYSIDFIDRPYSDPITARILIYTFYNDFDIDNYSISDVQDSILYALQQYANHYVKNYNQDILDVERKINFISQK
jgi:hypothetical protein